MSKEQFLRIDIDKQFGDDLKKFGKALPNIIDYSMGTVSRDLAEYIKKTFLNGRALAKVEGVTYDSIKAYKTRGGLNSVGVGVGVRERNGSKQGGLAYLARWNGTSREFMQRGLSEYQTSGKFMKIVEDNFEKMGKKMEVL